MNITDAPADAEAGGEGPGVTARAAGTLEFLGTFSLKIHMRVADQLGLAIVRGDYAPGAMLPPELRLCEMLGVSRTAMREAIRGLIAKGLIESRPKLGTRVRPAEFWNHLDPDVLRWRLAVSDTETYLAQDVRAAPRDGTGGLRDRGRERRRRRQGAPVGRLPRHGRCRQRQRALGRGGPRLPPRHLPRHPQRVFLAAGTALHFALREMFRIAALGSHRPRAIVEHNDVLRAILDGKPDLARAAAITLLGNATSDIQRIRGETPDLI